MQRGCAAKRVDEIEILAEALPPIAVLVSGEERVKPMADAIDRALTSSNIKVVPGHEGVPAGQDNDIRVFDVRHIKGLEFEAVFFLGLDELETTQPELFEKYLYVGATRAALFLGLTTADAALPMKIASLSDRFVPQWPKG